MSKVALIINPNAGRGKAGKIKAELVDAIQQFPDWQVDVFETEQQGHATKIADAQKNNHDLIIVAGGDGTINETVNGMMGGSAALAVIPVGSGNDFVKMLKMPADFNRSIKIIRQNNRQKIDIGQVNDIYFPNGLGIGFDAWVVRESMKVKKLRGFWIYLYSVLKTTFSYKNERIRLNVDGRESERDVFLIAFGNGVAMGGGFFLTPKAKFNDGLLDICIIRSLKIREVFRHLPKVLNGSHVKMEQVEMLQGKKIHITSEKGVAAHVDGELLGMDIKEFNIKINAQALEVIYNAE